MVNDEKKKLLIVSQFYIPDITAAAYRIYDMYEAAKDMYEIDILTSYPHKSNVEVKNYENNIYRVKISNKSKNRLFRYLNEYFGFMLKSIIISWKLKKRYDYVFVTSPPIFALVSGYLIAKIKKSKLFVDIRDIWPNVLIDDGTLVHSSIIYKILKKFEVYIYIKADEITCVSKYMKEYIHELSGKEAYVIYNGVSQTKKNSNNVKRNRDGKLNVFYTGNIGYYQHLDVLISCFQKYDCLSEMFNVHIIGDGTKLNEFKKAITENGVSSMKFYGPISKEETIKLTSKNADILFLNLHNSDTLEKTIPSKLFDYLYFNLPLVYGVMGEGREIIEELGCGQFFKWDNEESLYNALIIIYDDYEGFLQNSKNNMNFVCNKFNRKEMFYKYCSNFK